MAVILEKKSLNSFIVDREKKILKLCKSKSVLHLGCADYPFSVEQHREGNLLHEKLFKIAKNVFGIDFSQEGIDFLKSLGYENLLVGNVEELDKLNLIEKYDVIVAGELLEHLSNVGKFYENISCVMDNDSILIVTVPNAHSIKSFIRVLFGNELIHSDHVYYFSPATIEHICKRYDYELLAYFYYLSEPNGFIKRLMFLPIKHFIKFISPYIGDGLIFIMKRCLKNG